MSTHGPDDPESTPPPAPELGGLDPQDLLHAGLDTEPPVTLPQQPPDLDATLPVSNPPGSQSSPAQPELPMPEDLTTLLPGGNYHVECFLGQGGMGAVYKGTQVRLKRPVAIKIMRRDFGKDYDFEARFEREAQAMAKLNHPNIVSVIDYGEAGPDYLYIVMELVDGADLMDVIRTGRMTQEMALTLLPQICDALQFAHDHGIVHRDIKPSNIMLTRDGRIKMADFGLAKRFDAESSFRTQTGTGMGTPDYAAPEQFDANAPIDHRADIYALGVMIYQMITGQLPRGVWKPPSQRAEISPQWDDIVSRAMQSDPGDRYQHASDIKTDVSSIPRPRSSDVPVTSRTLAGSAGQAPRPGDKNVAAPSKSRAPLLLGLATGILALAVGAFFALRDSKLGQGSHRGSAPSLPESATQGVAPLPSSTPVPQGSAQGVQNMPSGTKPPPVAAAGSANKERQITADERKKIDEAWQKNRNADLNLITNGPAAPGSPWQPLFSETEWSASEGANRVFRDGWLHLTGHAITQTRVPSAEGKIRTKVRIAPGTAAPAIVLRDGQTEWRLEVNLVSTGKAVEFRVTKGTTGSTVPPKTQVHDERATAFEGIKDQAVIEVSLSGSSLLAVLTGSGTARAGVRYADEQLARVSEWGIDAKDAWFESVEVQPLQAAAVAPSPNLPVSKSSDPKFPPGQWVKVFTKPEDLPADLRKPDSGVNFEDGWIKGAQRKKLPLPMGTVANVGVRVRVKRLTTGGGTNGGGTSGINLRSHDDQRYQLRLLDDNMEALQFSDADDHAGQLLFVGPIAPTLQAGTVVVLEFAAVGSRLIGRAAGSVFKTFNNTGLKTGEAFLSGTDDLRDIEVMNLDGLPEAEALRLLGVDEKGNDLRAPVPAPAAPGK